MYLSHPVRRMRDDPIDGESVVLIVTADSDDDAAIEDLAERIEAVGGTVADRLQFGALRVETTEERVVRFCDLAGVESIETEHAIGIGGDAGEDI